MTNEKFKSELNSLDNFFTIYCKDKHTDQKRYIKNLIYKNTPYYIDSYLCKECEELLNYSINKLYECPHEIKPRCRRCPAPCYEKDKWKKIAKLMRYSGIKLGLSKLKKYFT